MSTRIHIQDFRDRLRVQVRQDLPPWERLLAAGCAAAFAGVASASVLTGWRWMILCPVVAGITYAAVKSTGAELQVTKFEFVSKGNLGRRGKTPRTVFTADVRGLEFGTESLSTRQGLCALTDQKEICLLPFVEWEQAQEIIRAIEKKFPGLAEGWRGSSPKSGHLTFGLMK
jgi:hypothetical protein